MVFIFGVGFILAGVITLIFFLRKVNLPRTEATIDKITLEFHKKDKQQLRKHPHANVHYYYKSVRYEAFIFLLKRKNKEGDQITVSFKENSPELPTMYTPRTELIGTIFLITIGVTLIFVSVLAMDYFQLWKR